MTYKELLEEVKQRRLAQLFEYEICTPKIAKDFLDKLSKLEGEDASSDEAKEVLKFKDQLKTASEGEEEIGQNLLTVVAWKFLSNSKAGKKASRRELLKPERLRAWWSMSKRSGFPIQR